MSVQADATTVRQFIEIISAHAAQIMNGADRTGVLQLCRIHPLDEKSADRVSVSATSRDGKEAATRRQRRTTHISAHGGEHRTQCGNEETVWAGLWSIAMPTGRVARGASRERDRDLAGHYHLWFCSIV
jgi:hypothetical protein